MSAKLPIQCDASPEELRKAGARATMRKALRLEYLRKRTDPHYTDPVVFDPCMQRYYSMHQTHFERFVPSIKNFSVWMMLVVIPITAYGLLLKKQRDDLERGCRSGEIKYEERVFRFN